MSTECNNKSGDKHATCQLAIRVAPVLEDAREVNTILTSSLRALFGELEPHSCTVRVKKSASEASFFIDCPMDSVAAVRSALSMVTPPAYLSSTIYRFDVINLKTE
jgi:RNase P/RNase MRP subunit POP5